MKENQHVSPEPISPLLSAYQKIIDFFSWAVLCQGNKARYLRRKGARIGQGCEIITAATLFGTEPWLIEIGNRVTITHGVVFLTHDGASRLFRHQIQNSSKFGNRFGRILIHDECFIGTNAILMPGIEIGPNSIVGAGSLVNKDVPPNMVYAGVPARPICTLAEYIQHYQEKSIPIQAEDRAGLRMELTKALWGEER
jgi:acetyltransferase-like isoleucine patch superfamily enzyme